MQNLEHFRLCIPQFKSPCSRIFRGNDLVENVAAERLPQTATHLCRARAVLARLSDDTFGVKGLHTSTLMHHVYDDVVAVVYLVSEGEAELKRFVDREG